MRPSRWQASPQATNAIDRFVLDYPRAGAMLQGSWLASGWDEYAVSLYRPLRGLARSHRYATDFKSCGVSVGAGKPAKSPVQALHHSSAAAGPKNS
ncbi:hypothetical protein D3C81_2067530 [compost metagenome]